MRHLLLLAALVAAFVFLVPVAFAQMIFAAPCGPRGQVEKDMNDDYGEAVAGAGFNTAGVPIVIYMNPTTRTFSILMRMTNGTTCVIAAGRDFVITDPGPDKGDL